jgi:hypothetical protein
MQQFGPLFYTISIWALPAIIAITFHEAAHGFAAHRYGDDTAWQLGRATLNPLKHIDPTGTIFLPGLPLLLHSPFLFGYAKPVPINFRALRHPRRDMVFVAAASPGMNIMLAVAAALLFYLVGSVTPSAADEQFAPTAVVQLPDAQILSAFDISFVDKMISFDRRPQVARWADADHDTPDHLRPCGSWPTDAIAGLRAEGGGG